MHDSTAAGARAIGLVAAALLVAAFALPARAHQTCAPEGAWTLPGSGPIATPELLARAAAAQVVLLGESHDNADHHRWELQTVAALAALHPKLVLGFEMFPRRVQAALDRWVAGKLSEAEFLKASDWSQVWGYDAAFYLPLFQFARLNRIPMVALNVERSFTRTVGANGLAAVPPEKREGVSEPAPASEAYLDALVPSVCTSTRRRRAPPRRAADPEFRHFVEAQLVWDRAMAQALAAAAARDPDALVVGVMGSSTSRTATACRTSSTASESSAWSRCCPGTRTTTAAHLSAGLATAVFGLPPDAAGDRRRRRRPCSAYRSKPSPTAFAWPP